MDISTLLKGLDPKHITVGVLGGHSALDVCHGAKKHGFRTVCVARKGREKTYAEYFRTRDVGSGKWKVDSGKLPTKGCIDEMILVDKFEDVLKEDVQKKLKSLNTIFVHNRYFWVYFSDYSKIENDFQIPIFGSRTFVKLEERDQPYNQYHLLKDAGIRMPKIFPKPADIDRPVLVKCPEAQRKYERAFFVAVNDANFEYEAEQRITKGQITKEGLKTAVIEELIVGAPINFNFFYSSLTGELELLGTDTRRQTNLDGFLRWPGYEQNLFREIGQIPVKMIETGHIACTVKESILEKAFDLGEKFVKATQKLPKNLDPSGKGIIGPFALQGAVTAEDGKEDIVIFDVSLRIPGSPGTFATPYSRYLYGETMSVGERVGMEIRRAADQGALDQILT